MKEVKEGGKERKWGWGGYDVKGRKQTLKKKG